MLEQSTFSGYLFPGTRGVVGALLTETLGR